MITSLNRCNCFACCEARLYEETEKRLSTQRDQSELPPLEGLESQPSKNVIGLLLNV